MTMTKIIKLISTNYRGLRIGQDHPNAKLTDVEVEALIRDRGPDEAPLMSYSQLAVKYGISKSGVRFIIIGERRCQARRYVKKEESARSFVDKKVRVNLLVSLRARAILHRLGGGRWINAIAVHVDKELRRAPNIDEEQAFERVLGRLCVTK
jgi:hypothetical protein